MGREIAAIRRFEGVDAMLAGLHAAGLALGLVSSNSAANARRLLGPGNLGLLGFLECGVAIHGKPARLARLLRRAGVAPAHALYVGDEIRDVLAARALGLRAGAVTWGYNAPEVLRAAAPDFLFEHVDAIPRALLRDAGSGPAQTDRGLTSPSQTNPSLREPCPP
jgi:phosphoglycolate phosphatase